MNTMNQKRIRRLIQGGLLFGAMICAGGQAMQGAQLERIPFPVDWDQIGKSEIDLGRFLDAPAGKHGFIRARGPHFVDQRGKRFRCWGVNITGPNCFPDKEQADRLVEIFSRLGINCIRFHGMDSAWGASSLDRNTGNTSRLDAETLARFDYFFYRLKQRGIYSNINLNVFRVFGSEDGLPNHEDLGLAKWAVYFYPRLIELQEKYARDLLTHVNPYTNSNYLEDPAVFVVEIVNENSLFEGWQMGKLVGQDDGSADTWSPIPIHYADELRTQFNDWLQQNRSAEQIAMMKFDADCDPDDPLELLKPEEFRAATRERFRTDYEFVLSTESRFFKRMKSLIKEELGLQSMLIGDADHNDSINGYPHILNNRRFDYLDGHGYWQHPSLGKSTRIRNTPMVNDPFDSTVVQFARTPMAGKPFVISETNHPYPHRYSVEGLPILTAYALLQDWDGLVFHEWGDGGYESGQAATSISKNGWFHLSADPSKVASLMVCGLMWHRQDIDPARDEILRSYSEKDVLNASRAERWRNRPFFDANFNRALPLISRTRWQVAQVPNEYSPVNARSEIVADTNQLRWQFYTQQRGRVCIDADHVQGMIGYQKNISGQNHPGVRHLSCDLNESFASVIVISLDDRSISESHRILLMVAGRAANADLTWEDDLQTVANWGSGPTSISTIRGSVSLWGIGSAKDKGDAAPIQVDLLGPVGQPTGSSWGVSAVTEGNGTKIELGQPALLAIIERGGDER
jgi:hypothetical protein